MNISATFIHLRTGTGFSINSAQNCYIMTALLISKAITWSNRISGAFPPAKFLCYLKLLFLV